LRSVDGAATDPKVLGYRAAAKVARGHLSAGISIYERVRPYYPAHVGLANNLGVAYLDAGRIADAIDTLRQAADQSASPVFASNYLASLNYSPQATPEHIYAEHARHGLTSLPSPDHLAVRPRNSRIRVGYLSPDFRNHSVSRFIGPILRSHDRKRFETFCYSNSSSVDDTTTRMQSDAMFWRDIHAFDDAHAVELIRADSLDILVDLAGHTSGNRLSVFAKRCAPVQVTYLGYPNTTGLPAMDYRLTDESADPPGEPDARHTETLVRIPSGFLAYDPPGNAPLSGSPPCIVNGYVTLCSYAAMPKINESIITLWARILRQVPRSRLRLKSRALRDSGIRRTLQEQFLRAGIEPQRLELVAFDASSDVHLRSYGEVDIQLDTYPYNGTTSSCESLWMGVPVITMAGVSHVSRVGLSLLTRIGHDHWIATSDDGYVDRAVKLASDIDQLVHFRATCRDQMAPVCNGAGVTGEIEAAYEMMVTSGANASTRGNSST
jgi:protein O-GlcNAc transferase